MHYFNKQSKLFFITFGFIIVLLVGGTNYLTGYQISCVLFYLLPISLVTWFVNRLSGLVLSCASAITWFIADWMGGAIYQHHLIPYWNATMILGVFSIFTYVLSSLKIALAHEKDLARSDYLTSVPNRRSFSEFVNMEIPRARRYKHPFTVACIDIDDFKTINDRLGHRAGDTVLRLVAESTKNILRGSDIVARIGGDEFAIFLPETAYKSAQIAIHKVQEHLLSVMQKNGWPVTFSIGAVTYIIPPNSLEEILNNPDILMYSVKNKGKNMVHHEIFDEKSTIQSKPLLLA